MPYTLPSDAHAIGDAGHTSDHNNIVDVVIGAGGVFNVLNTAYAGGADRTGAADSTAAFNAALTAAAAASPGGAVVRVPYGTYMISNLLIDSYVTLQGDGPATVLQGKSGSSGYMIALKTPATTKQITVRNLTLKPNTGSLGGIQIDNTGYGTASDPLHTLDQILILNAGGDAYHFGANARGMEILNCMQYTAGGYGFYIDVGATDNNFTDCFSGPSVNHGFYVLGWNNMFSGCKAFFAGYTAGVPGTTGCGFEIGANASNNTFANCSAQSNALHGFDLQGAVHCTIAGCEADSNSTGGAIGGAGVNMNGATYCTVTGVTGANTSGTQVYGLQIAGTQTDTWVTFSTVTGTGGNFNYVSGSGTTLMIQSLVDFGNVTSVRVNGLTSFNNIDIASAGAGLQVKEGSNCKQGTAPLSAGSVVVSNTSVTANSRIFLTSNADGGTPGWLRVSARTAGTSFTITSSSGTDTSTVAYQIFEPG